VSALSRLARHPCALRRRAQRARFFSLPERVLETRAAVAGTALFLIGPAHIYEGP